MTWTGLARRVLGTAVAVAALCGVARAGDDTSGLPPKIDDTGRLYLSVVAGMDFVLDTPFAGDVDVDGNPDDVLGGTLGYNLTRHWGLELQFQGTEPDLRSASRGKIREISIITVAAAARYRWHLADDRLVPYVTGGMGMSFTDVNEDAKPGAKANTDSSTILGSISAGLDWFLAEDVAAGVEARYLIHPGQDAEVSFQDPGSPRTRRFTGSTNLTSVSLLAHLTLFLGQQAGPEGERTLFLATHGPFDTAERRFYLAGLFGYDFLFDKDAGAGVKLRGKGGDFNLTKGGTLGMNFDAHWGAEVQVLLTPLTLRTAEISKIAEVNDTAVLPTLRYRWSLLGGRLVPFVTAGVGVGFLNVNDPRVAVDVPSAGGTRTVRSPKWDPDTPLFVGSVGAGVEYFLNRHFSVGAFLPFHFYPDTDVTVRYPDGTTATGSANFSGFIANLQLKAYLP